MSIFTLTIDSLKKLICFFISLVMSYWNDSVQFLYSFIVFFLYRFSNNIFERRKPAQYRIHIYTDTLFNSTTKKQYTSDYTHQKRAPDICEYQKLFTEFCEVFTEACAYRIVVLFLTDVRNLNLNAYPLIATSISLLICALFSMVNIIWSE